MSRASRSWCAKARVAGSSPRDLWTGWWRQWRTAFRRLPRSCRRWAVWRTGGSLCATPSRPKPPASVSSSMRRTPSEVRRDAATRNRLVSRNRRSIARSRPTMLDNIRQDLKAHGGKWGAQGFWALVVYRFGQWRYGVRPTLLRKFFSLIYRILYKLIQILTGIELPCEVKI